jgi:hypothetical protein
LTLQLLADCASVSDVKSIHQEIVSF